MREQKNRSAEQNDNEQKIVKSSRGTPAVRGYQGEPTQAWPAEGGLDDCYPVWSYLH